MSNSYFHFKQFTVHQDRSAMKVTTDACLFGAWTGEKVGSREPGVRSILDIGAGTGLLSLMMAQKTNAPITAIEIDRDGFEQASENVTASPWADRIHIIHGDAKNFPFPGTYDIIISNPPFYENELKSDDQKKNVAHHSEDLSLPQLLSIIKNTLSAEGTFYLLLPFKRNEEIKRLIRQHEFAIQEIILLRQSVSHDPFRIIVSGKLNSNTAPEIMISEICIKDAHDNYTQGFTELLREYYSTL